MAVVDNVTPRFGTGARHTRRFLYDFAALGGATGAKTLTDERGRVAKLPDNAVVTAARIEPLTAVTSGGSAEIALGVTDNDNAFLAATVYTDNKFDTVDNVAAINAEVPFKVNAAAGVSVLATITVAALTAGKFVVEVDYTQGA